MRIDKPNRVTRSHTQHLVAEPARVFPLLCPVREADWIEGWDPRAVWTESGVAERDCVFITASDSGEAVWFITEHSPERGFVEMLKITPGVTACRLSITLTPTPAGSDALVVYSHTSLGPAGDELVASFTEDQYRDFMTEWETQLNHWLTTGEQKTDTVC